MTVEQVRSGIASFPYWHYEFDLKGELTPAPGGLPNRHEQRKRYFFDPLVRLCGGTLAGKRVLDLGCTAGWWSLAAVESGCEFVLGLDTKPRNVEQARFVFETLEVERGRYEFVVGSAFELDELGVGSFDVVLCLGLLYHVSAPVALLRGISAHNEDVLLIDTALSRLPGPYLMLKRGETEHEISTRVDTLVMHPSRAAVRTLLTECGYRSATLKPRFTSYEGCGDYLAGRRRAFLCAKSSRLDAAGLDVETTPVRSIVGGLASAARAGAARAVGRDTRTGVG
jgi:SAM-dependent methyltransferase